MARVLLHQKDAPLRFPLLFWTPELWACKCGHSFGILSVDQRGGSSSKQAEEPSLDPSRPIIVTGFNARAPSAVPRKRKGRVRVRTTRREQHLWWRKLTSEPLDVPGVIHFAFGETPLVVPTKIRVSLQWERGWPYKFTSS